MAIKLEYFDISGYEESIRLMLHYMKEEFEDIRYDLRDRTEYDKIKPSLPFGLLPLYHEGDKILDQSLAIARYVGHRGQLVPEDIWEQAVLDAFALNIYDLLTKIRLYLAADEPETKESVKNPDFIELVDFYFKRFEDELQSNNGYIVGKLSWVDFVLIGMVEAFNSIFDFKLEDKYPNVLALGQNIRSLPGVKEYVSIRKPSVS